MEKLDTDPPMTFLQKHILLPVVLGLFYLPLRALDLSSLNEVFANPPGTDPVLEEIILNGSPQIRMTFKTGIPFPELKKYYTLLLTPENWGLFPLDHPFLTPFMTGRTDQMLFFRGKEILLISLLNTGSEKALMITFMEEFPCLTPKKGELEKWLVEGIHFPEALPVLQFEVRQSNAPGKNALLAFKTNSSADFILRYFEREILKKGWESSEMFDLFSQELQMFNIPGLDSVFKKIRFYRKQNRTLFFYASQNPSVPGTLFGYFYRG